jgi:hypothetical protein
MPAIAEPEQPQPLNPSPGPFIPFPYPTPHISLFDISENHLFFASQ